VNLEYCPEGRWRNDSRSRWYRVLAVAMILTLGLASCGAPTAWTPSAPTVQTPATATPPPPSATPTTAPPSPTAIPPTPTTAAPTAAPPPTIESLIASVQARVPKDAFSYGGVKVQPLAVPTGWRPLWLVYSYGMRNWDLKPLPDHFIAIFGQEKGAWQQLAWQFLASDDQSIASPDYVGDGSVTQVQIAAGRIWLQIEGGVGVHGGVFNLASFDGATLKFELAGFHVSPDVGQIRDVNGDGVNDVILNASDRYVFCYACGVTQIAFGVFRWDQGNRRMMEQPIQEMLMGQSGHPGRGLTNEAVMLARAGLWKDAMARITAAKQASRGVQPPFSNELVDWNYGIIKLHHDAMAVDLTQSAYPLLSYVFFGDYASAVNLMRPYSAAQLFSVASPLIKGTVAENWLPETTGHISTSASAAIQVQGDPSASSGQALAPAFFLRGWSSYLANPGNPAQARADVQKAASLAPQDALYKQAAALLAGQPPTPVPTPQATAAQPRRIQFAAGATSAAVQGRVTGENIDDYVLRALGGQWMMVQVSSAGNSVVLEIAGLSDGRPLVRSHMRQTFWQGALPATQDYSIKAVGTGAAANYSLSVIIPERVQFQPGAISATREGNLAGRQTHEYLLRALKGQTMTVAIQSPGNRVLLEIYGISDGQPLVRVPMGVTTWTGVLPNTQDYDIKAVSATDAATSYKIEFVVK